MDFQFEDDIFQSTKSSNLNNSLKNQYKAKIVEPKVILFKRKNKVNLN
jgi:hypothetical protein